MANVGKSSGMVVTNAVNWRPSVERNHSLAVIALVMTIQQLRVWSWGRSLPMASKHSQWYRDLAIWLDVAQRNLAVLPKSCLHNTARVDSDVILEEVKWLLFGNTMALTDGKNILSRIYSRHTVYAYCWAYTAAVHPLRDFWQSVCCCAAEQQGFTSLVVFMGC